MSIFFSFLPFIIFISIFFGSGCYYSLQGTSQAFYQLSPVSAMLPAICAAFLVRSGTLKEKIRDFLDGTRNSDIIAMCFIFFLAGAFSNVTKNMGSVDAIVQCILTILPSKWVLLSIFLVAVVLSSSIGTSMGTIATIAPIAYTLCQKLHLDPALCMGTVVSGAMFGDSLSPISDTTIAAISSQNACAKQKLRLNAWLALIAGGITAFTLYFMQPEVNVLLDAKPYDIWFILPYCVLLVLSFMGINVFVTLFLGLVVASMIAYFRSQVEILQISQWVNAGFSSMHEIALLSLLIGGVFGLSGKRCVSYLNEVICAFIHRYNLGHKTVQLLIGGTVAVCDVFLANNTIAIIFSGPIVAPIAQTKAIPSYYTATWLDIFSCVMQGIIPHGAQLLLAGAIGGISPIQISLHCYFCYILAFVACVYIILQPKNGCLDRKTL